MKFTKLFACACAVFVGATIQASTLYWQVDTEATTGIDYEYAQVAVHTTSPQAYLNVAGEGTPYVAEGSGAVYLDLSTYGTSGYSFAVELLDANLNVVGTSSTVTYDTLLASGYISSGGIDAPKSGSYLFSTAGSYSVPEPTSGVLLLIGGAMLALRRRRRV